VPRSPESTCNAVLEKVSLYLEGGLSPRDRESFEAHCATCPGCRLSLAQWQGMVGSLGQLEDHGKRTTGAERERLVGLFRECGLHQTGPRRPCIPLGLDNALAAPGDHLVYFWESEQEFNATAGFVAAGAEQGETCVLLGHAQAHERLARAIQEAGLDVGVLERESRLRFIADTGSADIVLESLGEQIKSAVDRGAPLVRILGNLGWGRRGTPGDRELLRLETQVTDVVRKLPVVVACSYDVSRISSRMLLLSGLECHPFVFRHRVLRHNELYVSAESSIPSNESVEVASPEDGGRTGGSADGDPSR